ncbi:MAG: amidohydrolase [Synergistaceae bacterium]|nr:amidohydrolase [Synergistaceae bacterium]
MSTLFKDVMILDGGMECALSGHVLVSKGRIESILKSDAPCPQADKVVEGNGRKAILPGFVNGHTHAAMSLLRGLGEELPLMEWLKERIWPVEAKLTPQIIHAGTELALLEMARTGTTCFADMYFEMEQVAEAAVSMGIRAGLCRGLMMNDDKRLEEGLALAEKWHGREGLITVQLGPHAPYTVPLDYLKKIVSIAKERNMGLHIHLLETEWEVGYFKDELKMSTEDWLKDSGMLELTHVLFAHGVWMNPEWALPANDNRLDFSNVTIAHCPGSNLKLGSGIFPLDKWLDAGVAVSLGTDGASSNNRLDMWQEMRSAALTQKGVFRDPLLGKASDVLRMATYEGALSLGFTNKGMLREGWVADLVLVDLDAPHYVGVNEGNLACFIVYAGCSEDVEGTMVAGKWIYKNGNYPACDKAKIIEAARAARDKLLEV